MYKKKKKPLANKKTFKETTSPTPVDMEQYPNPYMIKTSVPAVTKGPVKLQVKK